ncbi:MAG: hypothetical protein GY819_14065, partial [Planctomycetaceae bacterium]|nr:hypothetical protein [Planctomycetaceae bacterium]
AGSDVAAMAMTEIGGLSETSQGSGFSDSSMRMTPPPPPIQQTMTGQYQAAGHLDSGEPMVSINATVLIGVACLLLGLVVGFLMGKFI